MNVSFHSLYMMIDRSHAVLQAEKKSYKLRQQEKMIRFLWE